MNYITFDTTDMYFLCYMIHLMCVFWIQRNWKTATVGYKKAPKSAQIPISVYATNVILTAIDSSIITVNLIKMTWELTIWWL